MRGVIEARTNSDNVGGISERSANIHDSMHDPPSPFW
jgi:hypothetical protein